MREKSFAKCKQKQILVRDCLSATCSPSYWILIWLLLVSQLPDWMFLSFLDIFTTPRELLTSSLAHPTKQQITYLRKIILFMLFFG